MQFPLPLQPGDTVLFIAPASCVDFNHLVFAREVLNNWGLEIIDSPLLAKKHYRFSGILKDRVSEFQEALDNPNIKAIMCVRGGYGMVQLIDALDFGVFLKQPKWIVGFSDITVLSTHLAGLGVATIHGSMPLFFSENTPRSLYTLKAALFGENWRYKIAATTSNKVGIERGTLIGGNLCTLQGLIGTSSDFQPQGKILFLEEVNEPLYKIDRMLRHLHRAGKLKTLQGLIIGQFSGIDPKDSFGSSVYEIIRELTNVYSYPICFDFPVGHEADNLALVCGQEVILQVEEQEVTLQPN